MTLEQAIDLLSGMLRALLFVVGPLLAVSLVSGVLVGIVQTATQINEPSISFLVKVLSVVAAGTVLGSQLATYVVQYAHTSFEAVAQVVR
jgi:flagellar biosynthetic protein FliQ